MGVKVAQVTLHVGAGTFAPVRSDDITEHKMHSEWVECDQDVCDQIKHTKLNGGRVVAVGTTSVRVLESVAAVSGVKSNLRSIVSKSVITKSGASDNGDNGDNGGDEYDDLVWLKPYQGLTNIFIYPGFEFKVVDALITNFHLPKSSLLMLVSAFSSCEIIKEAYQSAIDNSYRFYSYGDAMFLC